MKNTVNLSIEIAGQWTPIETRAEVTYAFGAVIPSRFEYHPVRELTITGIKTIHQLPAGIFPITGQVVDCGSGIMSMLVIIVGADESVTANGRCASAAYHDRVVRHQLLRTGAERFQQALKEHQLITGNMPPRAVAVLQQFQ